MKKILFSLILLGISQLSFAQEAANKKFQGGIVVGAGMNFQNMGTKYVAKDGIGSDLLIGGNMNIMFTETVGLTTGVEFDFSTSKYKPGSHPLYYYYDDTKIIGIKDYDKDPSSVSHIYTLSERKQRSTYLTVPTMLIFRTKFIGYFRYFGKFGMRHSFLLGQKSQDEGKTLDLHNASVGLVDAENKNMKGRNEMVFYKGSVGISGGAEWNFSGSTTLMAEIGYYYGITPLYYKRDNAYLFTVENDANGIPTRKAVSNKATQGQLQLKVSILF
ncbi:MAG TPA: outer membrane beta-barrel protein [Taishania sp.]|nr:outer membrane beta-barrel protein [Taishania sp.]